MRFLFFLVGIGVGAGAALLFAPASGTERQEMLADKVEEGSRYLTERAREVCDLASNVAAISEKVLE